MAEPGTERGKHAGEDVFKTALLGLTASVTNTTQTKFEDEDENDVLRGRDAERQTRNAERRAQTRLTQMVNRILYRLAGLVLELASSAPLFTTVVYPP
jgi:hypothetical protein